MNHSSTAHKTNREDMHVIEGPCVCAIGVFDGVHLGHQALLKATSDDAAARGATSVAVTFNHDPDELFKPEKVHKLLSDKERIATLGYYADEVLALQFDRALAQQSWQEFLDGLLTLMPGLKAVHVGTNFRCGARALGGISELELWGKQNGINITAESLLIVDGLPVSASRIRALLAEGKVRDAAKLLTRPFALRGRVASGAGRGTSLGFATANVEVKGHFAEMGPFVYACYAYLDNEKFKAAVSIGKPPTYYPELKEFDPLLLEAHLLDFEGNLYEKELKLVFMDTLRPMQRFESEEELIATVKDNISWVRKNL